ncbi:PepSY domain-containing protein [uncultured Hyphomonas sp.]|uniref:PepSY-associated TM helix domain-containing protein n=1 Tax=uncultured Hyphomonas sp. TaxID=225298 RepID=UPI002AAACAC8|nr:PepSY domain-containing protein [uncultured Hyphomonas sp.]
MASAKRSTLQHRVWRWHFFAGLMVVPFVVTLAVTGAIYLFRPQIEAAQEARINALAGPGVQATQTVAADLIVTRALDAHPGSKLVRIVLPSSDADPTAEVEILAEGGARKLWLNKTDGTILEDVRSADIFLEFIKRIHGTLLGGDAGSLVVEIMACWTIILLVTGLFLWWPRGDVWWRIFLPDFRASGPGRETWKKVHGAAGAWIGSLAIIMLISGLPWTQVWGDGFTRAKELVGMKSPGQEWFVTLQSADPHALHEMGGTLWETDNEPARDEDGATGALMRATPLGIDTVVQQAVAEGFAPPVWVQPPRSENGVWTVRGMNPNRLQQETVHYDRWTGSQLMRIRFGDHNLADRAMALGVSFHEGALFGWGNQLLGLFAALGVALLAVTGTVMWWRRRPEGRLGVPPMPQDRTIALGVVAIILVLCLFLPMAGLTLLAALVADFCSSAILRQNGKHSS